MRNLLLLIMMIGSIGVSKADDYNYLTFETADGAMQSIVIDNLNVTFSEGNIVAVAGEDNLTVPLADMTKMYFTAEPHNETAISEAAKVETGVSVFSVSGVFVGRYANAQDAYSRLGKGLYVVKTNGKTYKMTVR